MCGFCNACVCVCVGVCIFLKFNNIQHAPLKLILHALWLNTYSMVTYNIYNLCRISSIVYSYSNFTFGSFM